MRAAVRFASAILAGPDPGLPGAAGPEASMLGGSHRPGHARSQEEHGIATASRHRRASVLAALLVACPVEAAAAAPPPSTGSTAHGDGVPPQRPETSVFAYGARWTDNRFLEILQFETAMRDSYLAAVGISRQLHRFGENLHLEGELNAARHWGQQDHFELNAAASLRWTRFPWDRLTDTSAAWGIGPSRAFGDPVIEDRRPSRTQVFMVAELAFAPPATRQGSWEAFLRIHHRSGVFGVVSDASGSNFIATGLRFHLGPGHW